MPVASTLGACAPESPTDEDESDIEEASQRDDDAIIGRADGLPAALVPLPLPKVVWLLSSMSQTAYWKLAVWRPVVSVP